MRLRGHPVLDDLETENPKTCVVDGKELRCYEGETIAAALIGAGVLVFRVSERLHEPRGAFCCVGRCTECLVRVEGLGEVKACTTKIRPGMRIHTGYGRPEL